MHHLFMILEVFIQPVKPYELNQTNLMAMRVYAGLQCGSGSKKKILMYMWCGSGFNFDTDKNQPNHNLC